jgi:hypothetical protein
MHDDACPIQPRSLVYIEWDKSRHAGQKRGILDDEAYYSLRLGPRRRFP